jgi:hypothetical protein
MAKVASRPQRARRTAQGGASIRVRMYRQGLGDCFLVSLLPSSREPFHLMIDCGVILGTPAAAAKLGVVIDDIIRETKGRVDVLAVTHEHYDHVAGFVLANERFAAPGKAENGKLSVGELWFAWTEDPKNPDAERLALSRKKRVAALAGLSARLHGMGLGESDAASHAMAALPFFGVEANGVGVGVTRQAMDIAAGFVAQPKYLKPGEILEPVPGLRAYVLGPPDDNLIKKLDAPSEVYHLDRDNLDEAVSLAAGGATEYPGWDPAAPFEAEWVRPLSAVIAGSETGPTRDFLAEIYLGAKAATPETDVSWRRIDGEWLASAEQLGLALDSATNNTSLAFAIELASSGDILLFPADAQVGNLLSWHNIAWQDPKISIDTLLSRVIFYKVGHHGSHNATLKAKELEMMPKTGLTAFVPVDHAMAVKKGWGQMPLPGLLDALAARCGDHLVRTDEPLKADLADLIAGPEVAEIAGPLYYDWIRPL